jgi:hypothetical protein
MKISLTGKIVWVGNNYADESPRASILINEGDEEKEPLSLEVDLGKNEAVELASHLYEEVRICIETISRPKAIE